MAAPLHAVLVEWEARPLGRVRTSHLRPTGLLTYANA